MVTKILVTRRINQNAIDILTSSGFEVKYYNENHSIDKETLIKILPEYDGVLCCVSEKIDSDLLNIAAPKLKAISNMAVGLDNIDVTLARSLGIEVFNTPNVVTESTADMTIAMAFSLTRHLLSANNFIKTGHWSGWDPEIFIGRSFSNLTWGIVGFGNIGKAVAKRLSGFGIKVYFFDPIETGYSQTTAVKTSLAVLLSMSDIISLHMPLSKETSQFFNMEKFSQMKPSSLLINMARGKIVNSVDLITALRMKTIAGAALDVFDPEPIPQNHEILRFDNVILTPHIGTATLECRRDMAVMAANNLINYFKLKL